MKITDKDKDSLSLAYKELIVKYINENYSTHPVELYCRQHDWIPVKIIPATDETYELTQMTKGDKFSYYPLLTKGHRPTIDVKVEITELYVYKAKVELTFDKFTHSFLTPLSKSEGPNKILYELEKALVIEVNKILLQEPRYITIEKYIQAWRSKLGYAERSFFDKSVS